MMPDTDYTVAAPRWPYMAMAVASILGLAFTIRIAPLGVWRDGTIDWGFYAVFGPLFLAALAGLVHNVASAMRPPRLRIAEQGLTLTTAWRKSYWPWQMVQAIRLYSPRRASPFVGFSIDKPNMRQPIWLSYPFAISAQDLFDKLRTASATGIGERASLPRTVSPQRAANRPVRTVRIALFIAVLAFACAAGIDSLRSTTELISPVDPELARNAGIGAWVILAVIVTAPLPRRDRYREPYPLRAQAVFRFILLILALPSMAAPAHVAARLTEHAAFRASRAPIEWWSYPVLRLTVGKGSAYVELEPYHHFLIMPISRRDYDRFGGTVRARDGLCYPILTQREGNAIRIVEPQRPDPDELLIAPCPSRKRPTTARR